eukprot:CAMPEP_0171187900 /NCGR_PEP_ID=MMETSP0790-20130122/17557_1 /TAXON_ID=2925 /ORGANISM="Alexandrium catenella, Strain OF101" /LENGTH=79 /DNA_ID=CAMNT_0011652971 /DNA_START=58 /DNA_END=294 /DNA_ORIENTATION=-
MAPLRLLCTLAVAPLLSALRMERQAAVAGPEGEAEVRLAAVGEESEGPAPHLRQPKIKMGRELAMHWDVSASERDSKME